MTNQKRTPYTTLGNIIFDGNRVYPLNSAIHDSRNVDCENDNSLNKSECITKDKIMDPILLKKVSNLEELNDTFDQFNRASVNSPKDIDFFFTIETEQNMIESMNENSQSSSGLKRLNFQCNNNSLPLELHEELTLDKQGNYNEFNKSTENYFIFDEFNDITIENYESNFKNSIVSCSTIEKRNQSIQNFLENEKSQENTSSPNEEKKEIITTNVSNFHNDKELESNFDSTSLPLPTFSSTVPKFISSSRKVTHSLILDSIFVPDSIKKQKFLRQPSKLDHQESFLDSPEKSISDGPMPIPTSDSVQIDPSLFQGNRIKVKIITFNMNGKSFSNARQKLKFMKPNSFHVYVFASQECERSIEKSFFNEKKKKWMGLLSKVFAEEYEFVSSINQMAMHLIVMVKKPLEKYISNIHSQKISCGWKNRVGNKGAVVISFSFGNTRLMFINCHLAAHQNNIQQRISDYHTIMRKLTYSEKDYEEPKRTSELGYQRYKVFNDFDYIFFAGDTNFRTDATRAQVDKWIEMFPKSKQILLEHDQLYKVRKSGLAFSHFEEGDINFLPTFKFDKESNIYDTSEKRRVPSYTDRILYYFNHDRSNEVFLQDYTIGDCIFSDHKPVLSKLLLKVNIS